MKKIHDISGYSRTNIPARSTEVCIKRHTEQKQISHKEYYHKSP